MGDEHSDHHQPLLVKKEDELGYVKKTSLLKSSAKWILKVAMWVIFIAWATYVFLFPMEFMNLLYHKWSSAGEGTVFGRAGNVFMLFGVPILMIVFLAIVYLIISGEEEIHESKTSKHLRYRLWTFPVLVDGPFGVVSAGELIGIIIFLVYIIWATSVYTIRDFADYSWLLASREESLQMLELAALRFGFVGLICLSVLFLPVARGSILLRLIDIPFEHATRYHVWLGHLTMSLFTLHALLYVTAWTLEGRLMQQLSEWRNTGVANLPGVITLLAGLLMWVTSLPGVRRQNFELFFYTHQLYVVFIVFLALHVGDFLFSIAAAGIFLFMLDRFLRFCQSRRTVDVLSATSFPCGTLELVISKPANLRYNALSWSFLQIRELSWLQWHPFSVSSSPLDAKDRMAFLIKVLGGWTAELKEQISSISEKESETGSLLKLDCKITASVEGPYGHESPYHLEYENLILVAGGIGISPFLAIQSDVLHRLRDGKPCLPKNILIVWAVKKSDELPLLQTVDMETIYPSFSNKLNLEIQTYVTRESEPSLEEGKVDKHVTSCVIPASKGCGMSVLVGTGSVVWSGLYIVVSTIGLVIFVSLLNIFYINPFNITYYWYKGILFLACMIASVLVFGGLVIGLWHLWGMKTSVQEYEDSGKLCSVQQNGHGTHKTSGQEQYASTVRYRQRPDFGEIFRSMSERWGNVDIGVIVCGPPTLQSSVAKQCRTQNITRSSNQAIFHFNSHSFDL